MVRVENRPYFPLLTVDPSDEASMASIARTIVDAYCADANGDGDPVDSDSDDNIAEAAQITRISGGLTNALFKVDFRPASPSMSVLSRRPSSVLIRIFGAEGMIDRDVETATFARLCGSGRKDNHYAVHSSSSVVHPSLDLIGRFANGRVESWIPGMRQSTTQDFDHNSFMEGVAKGLARLHHGFEIPDYLYGPNGGEDDANKGLRPTLWKVMGSWIMELEAFLQKDVVCEDDDLMQLFYVAAVGRETNENDTLSAMKDEIISHLKTEMKWLQSMVEDRHPGASVAFSHNDLCTANILLDASSENKCDKTTMCIIDYEYGSINYTMYDVANFFCELCGGNDNGIPSLLGYPSDERQRDFIRKYIRESKKVLFEKNGGAMGVTDKDEDECIHELQSQIRLFQLASNLIWGVWGLVQASGEVIHGTYCKKNVKLRLLGKVDLDVFDNLRYGKNRLGNYLICKERMQL
jgi:ethanolamine kinase